MFIYISLRKHTILPTRVQPVITPLFSRPHHFSHHHQHYFLQQMTKLGLQQPAVHSGGADDDHQQLEKEQIKIDPKVFTVLQPTVIPMPPAPQKSRAARSGCALAALRALLFVTLVVATAIALLFVGSAFDLIDFKQPTNVADKPQMEALIGGKFDGSSEKATDDIVAIPLARVVVVEDISNTNNNNNKKMNPMIEQQSQQVQQGEEEERPLHPDEIEMMRAARLFQQQQEEQMMAQRMWRLRRIQAALYQQQMMRMAQEQQEQQEMMIARNAWIERARWEAQQAAMWRQRQFEIQQQQQMQQQQQFFPRPAVWQQPPQRFFFPQQQQPQHVEFQPEQAAAPQPSVHDQIYEELQRKSQNIPVNAPTRQIWTAITPTPAPAAQPIIEETASTTPPPATTAVPDAAEVSDTILRDIFSAFDEQKNSEAAAAAAATQSPPQMEGQGAVVVEDRFPRIDERTTTSEPAQQQQQQQEEEQDDDDDESMEQQRDHEKELDPFAAVLKFFENAPSAIGAAAAAKPEEKSEIPTPKPTIVF